LSGTAYAPVFPGVVVWSPLIRALPLLKALFVFTLYWIVSPTEAMTLAQAYLFTSSFKASSVEHWPLIKELGSDEDLRAVT